MKNQRLSSILWPATLALAVIISFIFVSPAQTQEPVYDPNPHDNIITFCYTCHISTNSPPYAPLYCEDCHNGTNAPDVSTHGNGTSFQLGCNQCHNPHGSSNLSLIRDTVQVGGATTSGPVFFTARTGPDSFDEADTASGVPESQAQTADDICATCHNHPDRPGGPMGHIGGDDHNGTDYRGQDCIQCHSHNGGFMHGGGTGCGTSGGCHGTQGSHPTHVGSDQLSLQCSECHNMLTIPQFADGQNTITDTLVCDNCHTANGVALAKQYWDTPGSSARAAGSWAVVEGEKSFCGSCHDNTPGNTKRDGTGDTGFNALGNDSTYGFYVTGHGKETGNYEKLAWQDSAATGNPAANLSSCTTCHGIPPLDENGFPNPPFGSTPPVTPCSFCHDLESQHFDNSGKRLRTGFENDQDNTNCKKCHSSSPGGPEGTAASSEPHFYTNSGDYENSAHGDKLCTDCHDVHGAVGAYAGMTKANQENLCYTSGCHAVGIGGHPGVGAATFNHTGKSYTLECVSCHNVHLVSGTYNQADQNKSPITKFSDNTNLWGDEPGEKMDDYAGTGAYRTPKGELFSGAELPDYASFCTDCHGQAGVPPFGINWNNDPHGKNSANQPNGYGTCPNWYACGKASGWDNDDCVAADKNECWPVIPRGAGDQLFSRNAYTHTARIAGANFTLSCTDCHTGHGTGTLGRANVNGGSFTSIWNDMCNNCHYYYSDWHAGMSCGNASCHVSDRMNTSGVPATPHEMANAHGSGGTRTFNPDLVLYLKFDNNLKDSGGWQMDSKWMDNIAGSYTTGKSGQAIVLDGGKNIQVGTENDRWSTDAGYHGTWVYTEMKFNTTLEAWVYPTEDTGNEYTIFSKHVGVSNNGGYGFTLQKINGTLRATFNMAADNNGVNQDGRAGIRGAYSAIAIPLNTWTHVAATFDTTGPDRNPSDPSVGRIRIYVNGEDVTTSDLSGNNMQPGSNETSIYAFTENNGWNQVGVCYNDTWCASEFSVGGFYGWQNEFIGRIDEAKVWNITKDQAYFAAYDAGTPPYLSAVEGLIGSPRLEVTFSEGVYNSPGAGALAPSDFTLTDTDGNNPRSIIAVAHTAGSPTVVITMSQPLLVADVNADTLAAASNSVYDETSAAGTTPVVIGISSQCPVSPVTIPLNESPGSAYIMDTQNILYGEVNGGAAALTGSAYSGGGDGSGRYIMLDYNSTCLQATTALTLETRIKPTGIPNDTTTTYVRRVLARDGGGNYQMSVWRNNSWNVATYSAPAGESSIALWINPLDAHSGNAWKVVLTNYTGGKTGAENDCPIVSDHWYQVRAVWNTNKPGGTPGAFFQPADIYIDDQGTDGLGTGENWADYINCTDTDQSLKPDASKFYTNDQIEPADSSFAIGANRNNPANNLFNGLIDWITFDNGSGQEASPAVADGLKDTVYLPVILKGIGYEPEQ